MYQLIACTSLYKRCLSRSFRHVSASNYLLLVSAPNEKLRKEDLGTVLFSRWQLAKRDGRWWLKLLHSWRCGIFWWFYSWLAMCDFWWCLDEFLVLFKSAFEKFPSWSSMDNIDMDQITAEEVVESNYIVIIGVHLYMPQLLCTTETSQKRWNDAVPEVSRSPAPGFYFTKTTPEFVPGTLAPVWVRGCGLWKPTCKKRKRPGNKASSSSELGMCDVKLGSHGSSKSGWGSWDR